MPVRFNSRELQALEHLDELPEVLDAMQDAGELIAARARALAPKRTGAGAASIRGELVRDPIAGTHVRVAWDRDHFYMYFAEVGTEHQRASPFLRPAAAPYLDRPST